MKSQANRILDLLESKEWTCTSEMYALFIADPRTRICELRKKGHELESRKCQQHSYHDGVSKEWRLSNPRPYKIRELKLSDGTVVSREKIYV